MTPEIIEVTQATFVWSVIVSVWLVQTIGMLAVGKFLYEKYIIPILDITMDFLIRTGKKVLRK